MKKSYRIEELTPKKIKAHLVVLSGGGDTQVFIVDEAGLKFINEGGTAPNSVVEASAKDNEISFTEARESLEQMRSGSSIENDRALGMSGSMLGEDYYSSFDVDPAEIMAFCIDHNLDLDPENWEGYIY